MFGFGFFRHLLSYAIMVQTANKTLVLGLIACLGALLTPISAVAESTDPQTGKTLQPQGLNHAGVYSLRQIDNNLTGAGVKFAIICRSVTYINGEPQNDYRPSIEHNCLKTKEFSFHDQGELPAGIS
ncbi:MAG: hypothetical protein ACYSUB_22475, partial [Planctomycetota bacterium]